MKLKGAKEQVEQATKIQQCNLEIARLMREAVVNKDVWPDEKLDKDGNEVRKRYREEATEALDLLEQELKSPEAGFYSKGAHGPILDLEMAKAAAEETDNVNKAKKSEKRPERLLPRIQMLEERLQTVFSHMVAGKGFTYMKMVPEYGFSLTK